MTTAKCQTRNIDWGFFGTVAHDDSAPAQAEAFQMAMDAIVKAEGCTPEAARDFLDSRYGRHFAYEISNFTSGGKNDFAAGLQKAVERWQGFAPDYLGRHIRAAHDAAVQEFGN